jgi:CRISPR-associated protein Cmr3
MTTYLIEPLDTWFFREARPFEVAGGNELSSLFPPPARTVASALHGVLDRAPGGRWTGPSAAGRVSLDQARCRGPYLVRRLGDVWERLYPVPLDLLCQPDSPDQPDAPPAYACLTVPDRPVRCDLGGKVLLPVLKEEDRGARPVEDAWLTPAQFRAVLAGNLPAGRVLEAGEIFAEEPRVGLARDNRRRAYADGMLFGTRHLRLREGYALAADWDGAATPAGWQACVRFGGEGRLAQVSRIDGLAGVEAPAAQGGERGLILRLLTPAQFRPTTLPVAPGETERREPTTLPPGLDFDQRNGRAVWAGALRYTRAGRSAELPLEVHCAVIGKAPREGGWRVDRNRPRPARNVLPAGSLWYCTLEDQNAATLDAAITALHGARIGEETHLGRGELAVGLWPASAGAS